MKTFRVFAALLVLILGAYPVIAHHPAADMVDEEIYATIDEMVSETPHADMVFDQDMGNLTTTTMVIDGRVNDVIELVDNELLSYVALLDGDVTVTIEFPRTRQAEITIIQVEDPSLQDKESLVLEKSQALVDETTLDGLKASYR